MKKNSKVFMCVGLMVFIFITLSSYGFAAQEVLISDIKQNPSKYHNLPVKIKGSVVVDVTPSQPGLKSGLYTIRDESDKTIEVKTEELPAPGEAFIVEGIVAMKAGTQTPYLKELKRGKGSLLPYMVILAAVIVLILTGILVYLLRRPGDIEPAYEETGAPEPTRPIKAKDMKRVAPERTIEVPAIPAQLEVMNGLRKGEKYILKKNNRIGREEGDLTLGDPTVSTEHAQIAFKEKRYVLSNKSLTNPTKINKNTVERLHELKDGDEIVMGSIKLKFTLL